MANGIGMRLEGADQLTKALQNLDAKLAKKIVRKPMRDSAKRLRAEIAAEAPVGDAGALQLELSRAKIRSKGGRSALRLGVEMPSRESLGIPAWASGYYPFAIEYGYTHVGGQHFPPRRFIRQTVDESSRREFRLLATGIGSGIEKEAKSFFRRIKVRS